MNVTKIVKVIIGIIVLIFPFWSFGLDISTSSYNSNKNILNLPCINSANYSKQVHYTHNNYFALSNQDNGEYLVCIYHITNSNDVSTYDTYNRYDFSVLDRIQGLWISEDGYTMYISSWNSTKGYIYKYTTNIPFNFSSSNRIQTTYSVGGNVGGIDFFNNGNYAILTDATNNRLLIYPLSIPYDFSSRGSVIYANINQNNTYYLSIYGEDILLGNNFGVLYQYHIDDIDSGTISFIGQKTIRNADSQYHPRFAFGAILENSTIYVYSENNLYGFDLDYTYTPPGPAYTEANVTYDEDLGDNINLTTTDFPQNFLLYNNLHKYIKFNWNKTIEINPFGLTGTTTEDTQKIWVDDENTPYYLTGTGGTYIPLSNIEMGIDAYYNVGTGGYDDITYVVDVYSGSNTDPNNIIDVIFFPDHQDLFEQDGNFTYIDNPDLALSGFNIEDFEKGNYEFYCSTDFVYTSEKKDIVDNFLFQYKNLQNDDPLLVYKIELPERYDEYTYTRVDQDNILKGGLKDISFSVSSYGTTGDVVLSCFDSDHHLQEIFKENMILSMSGGNINTIPITYTYTGCTDTFVLDLQDFNTIYYGELENTFQATYNFELPEKEVKYYGCTNYTVPPVECAWTGTNVLDYTCGPTPACKVYDPVDTDSYISCIPDLTEIKENDPFSSKKDEVIYEECSSWMDIGCHISNGVNKIMHDAKEYFTPDLEQVKNLSRIKDVFEVIKNYVDFRIPVYYDNYIYMPGFVDMNGDRLSNSLTGSSVRIGTIPVKLDLLQNIPHKLECIDDICQIINIQTGYVLYVYKNNIYRKLLNHFMPVLFALLYITLVFGFIWLFVVFPYKWVEKIADFVVSFFVMSFMPSSKQGGTNVWVGIFEGIVQSTYYLIAAAIGGFYLGNLSPVYISYKYAIGTFLIFINHTMFHFDGIQMTTVINFMMGIFYGFMFLWALRRLFNKYGRVN